MVESREAERRQQTEGSLCLWGKERLRNIDVKMEERDEERQFGMETRLLALNRERVDEAKTEMILKNELRGKRERAKLKSNENTLPRDSSFMFWKDASNMRDPDCRKHKGFYPEEVYREWTMRLRSKRDLFVY